MKKLLLLCLAVMCTLTFGLAGCDDDNGLTCAEQIAKYQACVLENCSKRALVCEACVGMVDPSCEQ